MLTLPELLKITVDKEGSDLHISTATPPQVRVHGHLQRLPMPEMSPSETKQLVYSVLTDSQKKRFEETLDDFSFGIKGLARFRATCSTRGAVATIIARFRKKFARSGAQVADVLSTLAERRGLVLTGPTGSGSRPRSPPSDKINIERKGPIPP
jgi:twitching motility protein PilT